MTASASVPPADAVALRARQQALLDQAATLEARFAALQQRLQQQQQQPGKGQQQAKSKARHANNSAKAKPNAAAVAPAPAAVTPVAVDNSWADRSSYVADQEGVVPRLEKLASEMGFQNHRFYRVDSSYYSWTLEQRRDVLGVPTTRNLFKSVIMHNTHFNPPETEGNRRHICVIVSYAEKLHKEKLASAVYEHYKACTGPAALSKKGFKANWRLADENDALELTGYAHNATTPLGLRTPNLLMVMSATASIAPGGSICLGGGEVDVKWRVSVEEFVRIFKPIVASIATSDAE